MDTMRAYKLMRLLKDGSLRSLFIDRCTDRPVGQWMKAEDHPTEGYQRRFGWHCTFLPVAPHLTMNDRVWVEVELRGEVEVHVRPEKQGGRWLLGKGDMKIVRLLTEHDVLALANPGDEYPLECIQEADE